jgi:hypothetical protein
VGHVSQASTSADKPATPANLREQEVLQCLVRVLHHVQRSEIAASLIVVTWRKEMVIKTYVEVNILKEMLRPHGHGVYDVGLY